MDQPKTVEWAIVEVRRAALRSLGRSDVTDPLARAAVLAAAARTLGEMADREADVAVRTGASYGAAGRALGISRQALRRRYVRAETA